VSQPAAKVN